MKLSPSLSLAAAGAGLMLAGLPIANAQLVSSIGTAHFSDGEVIGTGTFITAVAGQPAPFNAFIGSDASGPNFDASWTMTYAAPLLVGSASLTFGIYDHDSQASATPVSFFSVGGVNLTSSLNTVMTAHGGANGEYDVYTLNLPISTYVALQSGSVDFQLSLGGPGLSVIGNTPSNGAGLDYMNLYLAVPEPATEAWFGVGAVLALVGVRASRRAR